VRKDEQRRGRRKRLPGSPRNRQRSRRRRRRGRPRRPRRRRTLAAARCGTADFAVAPASIETPKTEDEKKQEAFDLVLATIEALAEDREEDEKICGSMIKQH